MGNDIFVDTKVCFPLAPLRKGEAKVSTSI